MNLNNIKAFYAHTLMSCLLILDFFLFTTGNPSATYIIIGGWFLIPLALVAISTASYGYAVAIGTKSKAPFVLHLLVVGMLSFLLLVLSGHAKQFAASRLEEEVGSFVRNPIDAKAEVSVEERRLMILVNKQKYSMKYEGFIPTFRRVDFFLRTETGEQYRLTLTMRWNGVPKIFLRPVKG